MSGPPVTGWRVRARARWHNLWRRVRTFGRSTRATLKQGFHSAAQAIGAVAGAVWKGLVRLLTDFAALTTGRRSVKARMSRRGSRLLTAAQIVCGFVTWISAGVFVNDCTSSTTFKADWHKTKILAAVEALGAANILAVLLIASLAAQLWLPELASERRAAGEGAIDSITKLFTATTRAMTSSASDKHVQVRGFFHLAVGDYLVAVAAATPSGAYIPDEQSVISISLTRTGPKPFFISRVFAGPARLLKGDLLEGDSDQERHYLATDYRAIIAACVYDYSDASRPIGTISFGSDHSMAETGFDAADPIVLELASVVGHLWRLVGRRDPKVRVLQAALRKAMREHDMHEAVFAIPSEQLSGVLPNDTI